MRLFCAIFLAAAGLGHTSPGQSSDPVYTDLDGVASHPLDAGESAASVLFFYWHDCPLCNACAPEINHICAAYTNFAFYIVQVDPDLSAAAAREHAREYDLRAPILLDHRHYLVKLAGATVTPEAVVVGRDRQILYRGRIDDHYPALGKMRPAATRHDLREALDAISAGKTVRKKETKAVGCLIE